MHSFIPSVPSAAPGLHLSDFNGANLSRVRGLAFTAGQPVGAFEFQIDSVELE